MENKFDEKQSLQVISSMIAQARSRIEKGDGNYFMWWGYVIAIASLLHYAWLLYDVQQAGTSANMIWGIATPVGLLGMVIIWLIGRKKSVGKAYVRTYTGSLGTAVWAGFCVSAFAVSFLFGGKYGAFIYPVISLMYTFALFVTARVYRFRWMYWCVAVCSLCVIAYKFTGMLHYPLLMAFIMIAGNVVPGHIINCKAKRRV